MGTKKMKSLKKALLFISAATVSAAAAALPTASWASGPPRYTFAIITHGQPGDTFWDVIRKGAQAAALKDNVKLIYLANPTGSGESQLVTNVLQQHVDGIALTLAFPLAMSTAVKQAVSQNVPVVAFNAAGDNWKQMGVMSYIGTDETSSGMVVGDRLNAAGVTAALCIDQEQGAIQLEDRCDGIQKTFKGKLSTVYVPGYDMASAQSRITAKLQQDPAVGFVITLGADFVPPALQAIKIANSKAQVGTFGLDPRAITLIEQGKLQWAIDIQPFVQGYESIDSLWLYKINGDVIGGGGPLLTGPTFVTKENAAQIGQFAKQGTR
jgi:simple sugar transport system substrate-binding protein